MTERLRLRSACLFFTATRSKALELPNARANAFCSMHFFSGVCAVRGQKQLMFPKGYCVTVRHDFDNESTARREVFAIFKNRNFVPRGTSNPRQAHREKLPS